MNTGYIKTYRKLLEWEWYTDGNVMRLFTHCLLKANHKDKKWRGTTIKRGSFITSYRKLSDELHLSLRQIRVALDKLKMTKELTHKPTANYSIIYINNYDDYQSNDTVNDKRMTSNTSVERQTNDKRMTTTKNEKNDKNDKKIRNKESIASVLLSINNPKLQNALDEFVDMRKTIKAKLTPHALKLIINKLDKLAKDDDIKIQIINQSIMNGWKSVFPLKDNYKNDRNVKREVPNPSWMDEEVKDKDVKNEELKKMLKELS